MSYFAASNTGANYNSHGVTIYASTPLLADIAAVQRLYGASTTTRTGNNTYGFNSNSGPQYALVAPDEHFVFTIYDAGGQDTLDVSGYADNQRINLNQGAFSDVGSLIGNVSIALGTVIERAIGGAGNDSFMGNNANDFFTGGGGADTITGGTGRDTAIYAGQRGQYTVATGAGGALTVTDNTAGRDGVDALSSVERLQFSDAVLAFDIAGNAGQAYRLYQAAFNRTPDLPGVSFWVRQMDNGLSLAAEANEFVNSAEFKSLYGTNPTALQIVSSLYQNILGQPAEQAGLDFWVGNVNNGLSKAGLLEAFSESPENHTRVDPGISTGIRLDLTQFV